MFDRKTQIHNNNKKNLILLCESKSFYSFIDCYGEGLLKLFIRVICWEAELIEAVEGRSEGRKKERREERKIDRRKEKEERKGEEWKWREGER